MAITTLVAGAYSHTYNSVSTGITRDGYRLEQQLKEEVINETDIYGGSIIDYVYRGGDVYLDYVCKSYMDGTLTPFWPFANHGEMGRTNAPLGRLASAIAAASVLTATANTPAAAAPATLTIPGAILAPGFSGQMLFNSKVREVPIKVLALPYDVGSNGSVRWFTKT